MVSASKDVLAGAFGGICSVLVGHPFDTIKVRLQAQPKTKHGQMPLYSGTWDCVMKTIRNEGFFALYKGMTAILAGTPLCSIGFLGFGIGKKLQRQTPEQELSAIQLFNAGCLAGVCTGVIMAPAERVKCLLQVQNTLGGAKIYKGPFDVVKKLYAEGGISSIYKGTVITLIREVPSCGMYYMSYEWLKRTMLPTNQQQPGELNVATTLTAGGMAGVLSWTVSIVPDVLKSKLQTAQDGKYPNGIRSVFVEVMETEGPRGLFKGFTIVILRAFPTNAACFLGYECAIKLLNWVVPNL